MDEFVSVESQEVAEPETQSVESQEVAELEPTDTEEQTTGQEDVQTEELNQDNTTEEGRENNAVIAEMRRKAEEERAERERLEELIEQERSEKESLEQWRTMQEAARKMGLSDDEFAEIWSEKEAEDELARAEAEKEAEIERIKQEKEEERLLREQTEQELLDIKFEKILQDDLKELQKIDPNLKTTQDLPRDYFELMANGSLKNHEAYKIAVEREKASKRTLPEEIGQVNSPSTEKDYFTREEVENMSEEEVMRNLDKINKSSEKWK
jgi:hypothetical protein